MTRRRKRHRRLSGCGSGSGLGAPKKHVQRDPAQKKKKNITATAQRAARSLLDKAERSAGDVASCQTKLEAARTAFDRASSCKISRGRTKNACRDGFVKATFQAGQANACAVAHGAGPRLRKPKRARKKRAA